MHALETINALNERAVQQCESCKKFHCDYPGREILVAEYDITVDDATPDVVVRKKLCPVCVNAVSEATTDFAVRRVA